jgi:O-acetyl-ADP-ribose deacetylase (regulator of RNase III)
MLYIQGDLISFAEAVEKTNDDNQIAVVHGCNCFCTMGSGLAKQIRDRYPAAYEADQKTKKGDRSKLGTYSHAKISDSLVVINAYTQYNYGRDINTVYVDYESVGEVFAKIAQDFPNHALLIPKIGAGLANGDWEILEDQICDHASPELYVVEYNPSVPKGTNHFQQALLEFMEWGGLSVDQLGELFGFFGDVKFYVQGELPSPRTAALCYYKMCKFEKRPPIQIRVTEKFRGGDELECVVFGLQGGREELEQVLGTPVGSKVAVWHKVTNPELILLMLTGHDKRGLEAHYFYPTFVNTKTGEAYEF